MSVFETVYKGARPRCTNLSAPGAVVTEGKPAAYLIAKDVNYKRGGCNVIHDDAGMSVLTAEGGAYTLTGHSVLSIGDGAAGNLWS